MGVGKTRVIANPLARAGQGAQDGAAVVTLQVVDPGKALPTQPTDRSQHVAQAVTWLRAHGERRPGMKNGGKKRSGQEMDLVTRMVGEQCLHQRRRHHDVAERA